MAAVVGLMAVLSVGAASVATLYAGRAQATAAADAAALAAAVATYPPAAAGEPRLRAGDVASANSAFLLSCRCPSDNSLRTRVVEIVAGVVTDIPIFGEVTVRATSRAEFDPLEWLGW